MPRIAYAVWLTGCQGQGCSNCAKLEGLHWVPGKLRLPPPPLAGCSRPRGCACMVEEVMGSEDGASGIAAFITGKGGAATGADVDAFEAQREGRAREAARAANAGADMASQAYEQEIIDPERSISLYRKALQIERRRGSSERWDAARVAYICNRLSMLLDRAGRREESLREIWSFETSQPGAGTAADRTAMAKRRDRLVGKLSSGGWAPPEGDGGDQFVRWLSEAVLEWFTGHTRQVGAKRQRGGS